MTSACFEINGGDFVLAGGASKALKEMLKKVGVKPATIRKVMIAAYEAEMNVVIHATRGVMNVALDSDRVDVVVADEGPGIPDIERAMQEGFSTAPPSVRELGFGAGMGLPNIKRNSDTFDITSVQGKGTKVCFGVLIEADRAAAAATHSIRIVESQCRQCLRCLHACPTAALRVREGRPAILAHVCIDCPVCIDVCPAGALGVACDGHLPEPSGDGVLVVPEPFLYQFGPGVPPTHVLGVLGELGFGRVRLLEEWTRGLRHAVEDYAASEAAPKPVLVPVCPAVTNLVATRFPALLEHVAPLYSPVEAAQRELADEKPLFVIECPAQHSALGDAARIAPPSGLLNAVFPRVTGATSSTPKAAAADTKPPWPRVFGLSHAMGVLEAVENGVLVDAQILELYACDEGCFGSPLWKEEAAISRFRAERAARVTVEEARAVRRTDLLKPRSSLRLDEDMSRAMAKLTELDRLVKRLPGRDCAVCGAPSCMALAEDVVTGRAQATACPYVSDYKEQTHEDE